MTDISECKTVSAVIVAAGQGTRMNMNVRKQFIGIAGVPVLARTIKAFEDCELINEIIVVVNSSDIMYCKQAIVDCYGFKKVKVIVSGGNERQDSVFNGLRQVDQECSVVVIHDGARPFVENEHIRSCIEAANEFGAASLAVPVKDTIKSGDADGFVSQTLERKHLWSIQTPQGFRYPVIIKAHEKAIEEGYTGTDDCVLAERLGIRTKLVTGSYYNIKITTKEDIAIAEAIVQNYFGSD